MKISNKQKIYFLMISLLILSLTLTNCFLNEPVSGTLSFDIFQGFIRLEAEGSDFVFQENKSISDNEDDTTYLGTWGNLNGKYVQIVVPTSCASGDIYTNNDYYENIGSLNFFYIDGYGNTYSPSRDRNFNLRIIKWDSKGSGRFEGTLWSYQNESELYVSDGVFIGTIEK